MIITFEGLPNEILLRVFSYFSWSELLTFLWSLNARFDTLICSLLSKFNNVLIIIEPYLSFAKCHAILFPLVSLSSSLLTCIQRIHIDETNPSAYDLIYGMTF
ncbi:unnamed protein product [Rotaria sp. Silwood2]|nr:unnamed protein product [Rotaria sp. Silwood2]CAF4098594.1 unnamed protein product [Rotaria sp. Silwood2]